MEEEKNNNYRKISAEDFQLICEAGVQARKDFNDLFIKEWIVFENIEVVKSVKPISLKHTYNPNLKILIKSGSYQNLTIDGIKITQLKVEGGEFSNVSWKRGKINTFEFLNGEIDKLEVTGGEFNNFKIKGGHIGTYCVRAGKHNKLLIKECLIDKVDIAGGEFENIYIDGGTYQNVFIKSASSKLFSFVSGAIHDKLHLGDSQIERISITKEKNIKRERPCITTLEFNQKTANAVFISECYIGLVEFNNSILPSNTIIHINKVTLNKLIFNKLKNTGKITFNDVLMFKTDIASVFLGRKLENDSNTSLLKFSSSSLGQTEFINCQFNNTSEILFFSSNITELAIIGSNFPNVVSTTIDGNDRYKQIRLGHEQLKKVYESRGAQIEATESRSKELYNHLLELFHYKVLADTIKYVLLNRLMGLIIQLPSILNLLLNLLSTNFGRWWLQGAVMTLTVAGLLLWWYSNQFGIVAYNPFFANTNQWDKFWELSSYLLDFINPIHKSDFMTDAFPTFDKIPSKARVIEGVSRIVNSYMIYQTIQAFRKHGRR